MAERTETSKTKALESNKAVLRRHFDEVLNMGLLDVIDQAQVEQMVAFAGRGPLPEAALQRIRHIWQQQE